MADPGHGLFPAAAAVLGLTLLFLPTPAVFQRANLEFPQYRWKAVFGRAR
jgi:hypothetical protein